MDEPLLKLEKRTLETENICMRELASQCGFLFKKRYLMAPFRCGNCGAHSGRSAADHRYMFSALRCRYQSGNLVLEPQLRIDRTKADPRGANRSMTAIAHDAWNNIRGPFLANFFKIVKICKKGPPHADQVTVSAAKIVLYNRRILETAIECQKSMEACGPDLAGIIRRLMDSGKIICGRLRQKRVPLSQLDNVNDPVKGQKKFNGIL